MNRRRLYTHLDQEQSARVAWLLKPATARDLYAWDDVHPDWFSDALLTEHRAEVLAAAHAADVPAVVVASAWAHVLRLFKVDRKRRISNYALSA